MIRVVLADDQALVRMGLRVLIESEDDLELAGEAENGRAAVVMELCSPDGRLVTQLLTNELYRFLTRTLAVVPLGTESIDLDEMVAAITGDSQTQ